MNCIYPFVNIDNNRIFVTCTKCEQGIINWRMQGSLVTLSLELNVVDISKGITLLDTMGCGLVPQDAIPEKTIKLQLNGDIVLTITAAGVISIIGTSNIMNNTVSYIQPSLSNGIQKSDSDIIMSKLSAKEPIPENIVKYLDREYLVKKLIPVDTKSGPYILDSTPDDPIEIKVDLEPEVN